MKKINLLKASMAFAILFAFGSCNKNADKSINSLNQLKVVTEEMMSEKGTNPDEVAVKENSDSGSPGNELNTPLGEGRNKGHYLYTESNSADQNHIVVYAIRANGSLEHKGNTASGGAGTGKGLGSQGALVVDKDHEWLYAVNAGSNSVSSFKVNNDGTVTLAHTASTGGTTPVSVSVSGNLLYVLNRGSDNIDGYHIGSGGSLSHIAGSTQPLSSTSADAPQISFSPDGIWVIVTEKATNIIGTFKVNNDGSVNAGTFTTSVGPTPFGFEFSRDRFMIVSNAAGGAAGAGSSTSYTIGSNGVPDDVNGAVPNYQAAPCWFAITKYGRYAYTTNTASNNISSYYVADWGGLYLIEGEAASTDMGPVDIVVAANNFYVYELNGKSNTIGEYRRMHFGGLKSIGSEVGVPVAATGLATY